MWPYVRLFPHILPPILSDVWVGVPEGASGEPPASSLACLAICYLNRPLGDEVCVQRGGDLRWLDPDLQAVGQTRP